jgi:HAD superfamily hydrolase (TIGR01549 family)
MFKPELIIYDFDGVICDSVNIKTEAFTELYKNYGAEIQSMVKEYHLQNGGISRLEKFRYFQSVLINKDVIEEEIFELANQFSLLVKEKVITSQYINGVLDFIKLNADKKQFICTGTPETEIIEIVERKEISIYFQNLYGSPKGKTEIIDLILSQTSIPNQNCVFFGDTMTDYIAAKLSNIPFIGIKNSHTIFPQGTTVITDFTDPKLKL